MNDYLFEDVPVYVKTGDGPTMKIGDIRLDTNGAEKFLGENFWHEAEFENIDMVEVFKWTLAETQSQLPDILRKFADKIENGNPKTS